MNKNEIRDLLDRFAKGECTSDESAFVQSWYINAADQAEVSVTPAELAERKQQTLSSFPAYAPKRPKLIYLRYAAAVAAISLGVWLYYSSDRSGPSSRGTEGTLVYANDIAPGKNTAILTLANGKTILLSDAKSGVVIDASGLAYSDGEELSISSESGPRRGGPEVSSETTQFSGSRWAGSKVMGVSTPRGGTYQVVLPDGTKVWLNADSKISFPSQFDKAERRISLEGEAYFQVAKMMIKDKGSGSKDQRMPFIVESKDQEVEVLGTHFNINSYTDEGSTKTTLLEGSVRVSAGGGNLPGRGPSSIAGAATILKPGQQAVLMVNTDIRVQKVNPTDVLDWKEGYFMFNTESLESIMRKLSRWYNVEVRFEDQSLKKETFFGTIGKYEHISKVLSMLEKTDVALFTVSGNKITVHKKK